MVIVAFLVIVCEFNKKGRADEKSILQIGRLCKIRSFFPICSLCLHGFSKNISSNILDKIKRNPRTILRYFKMNNLRYPVDAIIEIRNKICY